MIFDMLVVFAIVTIMCFILSLFLLEEYPMISVAFISLGMIFSVLCTYGFWDVEFFYTGYNSTTGNTSAYIYSTTVYGDPYSYIFFVIFFMFMVLFFKAGFNLWRDALRTQGEMDYKSKGRRFR